MQGPNSGRQKGAELRKVRHRGDRKVRKDGMPGMEAIMHKTRS